MQMFLHISSGGQDDNEMRWLDVNDGFLVINAMRELGLRPSRMALEALLDGCAASNDSEQAYRVLQEMEGEGLQLNIFSMIRYGDISHDRCARKGAPQYVILL